MKLNNLNLAVALVAGLTLAPSAFAVDDYSGVLTGLSAATAITAIIAAGGIKAGVGFARWATNRVASFFR